MARAVISSTLPVPLMARYLGAWAGSCLRPARVVVDQRAGLRAVDLKALLHGFFLVVLALDQVLAGHVVLAGYFGWIELDVVGAAAGGVRAAAAHALDDGVEGHVDFQHVVELDAGCLQGVGLWNGAREAVKEEALGAVRLGDAFLNQTDDDVVADQGARVHDGLGLQAQRRARFDRRAQHVAGGDLRDAVFLADERGLRALSGAGGAEQDQSHGSPLSV